MKILISAAEASSDTHGAELLRAIQNQVQSEVEAFGIGGPKLRKAGLEIVVDAKDLLAMGFSEVLKRLPKVITALSKITQAAYERKPDVAVVIDYPDFHFRLAHRLKHQGIPVIYYIPPKVWVWRKRRTRLLKVLFDHILCILPFEEKFYREHNIPATYVGNPLLDELPLTLSKADARKALKLSKDDKVIVVMPGSRPSELAQHFELMLEATDLAARALKMGGNIPEDSKVKVLVPFPLTVDQDFIEKKKVHLDRFSKHLEVTLSYGNASECLVAADAGLVKSGTSTLEAGLLGCPHLVVYKPGATTTWIFKNLIRYKGPVGLVNLVMEGPKGKCIVPEILCDEVTQDNLANPLVELLINSRKRDEMTSAFDKLKEGLSKNASPSVQAAQEVIRLVKRRREQCWKGHS